MFAAAIPVGEPSWAASPNPYTEPVEPSIQYPERAATVMVIGELTAEGLTPFEARTVKVKVPAAVGVPDNTPLVELRLSPAGRLPLPTVKPGAGFPVALKVYGPKPAPTVAEVAGEEAVSTGAVAAGGGAAGTTGFDGADGGLDPAVLAATTVKV